MRTEITAIVDRMVHDEEGAGYHIEDPPVCFHLENCLEPVVEIICGVENVLRIHLSDFLDVAERLNGAAKYRTDWPPFTQSE